MHTQNNHALVCGVNCRQTHGEQATQYLHRWVGMSIQKCSHGIRLLRDCSDMQQCASVIPWQNTNNSSFTSSSRLEQCAVWNWVENRGHTYIKIHTHTWTRTHFTHVLRCWQALTITSGVPAVKAAMASAVGPLIVMHGKIHRKMEIRKWQKH